MPRATLWSVGVVYQSAPAVGSGSAVFLAQTGARRYVTGHWQASDGEVVDFTADLLPSAIELDIAPGDSVRLAVDTDDRGTTMRLNGITTLRRPAAHTTPRSGEMKVCAGVYPGEEKSYSVTVRGLVGEWW